MGHSVEQSQQTGPPRHCCPPLPSVLIGSAERFHPRVLLTSLMHLVGALIHFAFHCLVWLHKAASAQNWRSGLQAMSCALCEATSLHFCVLWYAALPAPAACPAPTACLGGVCAGINMLLSAHDNRLSGALPIGLHLLPVFVSLPMAACFSCPTSQ